LNLKNSYWWFIKRVEKVKNLSRKEKNKIQNEILLLHGLEIVFLILTWAFIWKWFLFVATGLSFHLFLDVFHQKSYRDRIDKVSLIQDINRFNLLEELSL